MPALRVQISQVLARNGVEAKIAVVNQNLHVVQGELEALGRQSAQQHLELQSVVDRAVQMTVGGVAGWYRQTLDGSFSSVSRPIFASK